MQIETRLLERSGSAVTNFEASLPKPQSDLARESLKDPYRFDFLGLTDEAQEREVEHALVKHVTEFLLELGAGFAFVGRQVQTRASGAAGVLPDCGGPPDQKRARQPHHWPIAVQEQEQARSRISLGR